MSELDEYQLVRADEETQEEPLGSVFLTEEDRKKFIDWIQWEYEMAKSEREEKLEDWNRFRNSRESIPDQKVKNYPWRNASNVRVPVTDINVKTMYGALMTSFGARKPFWTINSMQPNNDVERRKAEVVEDYMQKLAESRNDLNMKKKNRTILYENASMGTAWIKVHWLRRPWAFKTKDYAGNLTLVTAYKHDGPAVEWIPPEDAVYREGYDDVQILPWFIHMVHKPWHTLKNQVEMGQYRSGVAEELKAWARTAPTSQEHVQAEIRGVQLHEQRKWDIAEIYAYYDADGDGILEDIICSVHLESGIILRESYNELGWRPFVASNFMERPGSLDGRGVCHTSDGMQAEADTTHNMRIDSAHIAGIRMLAMRRYSGMRQKEEIRPGKIWYFDNPKEDIQPVQLGEVYPSSINAEMAAMQYAMRNSAVSDIMGGFADQTAKSGDTSSGQMLRLQQSSAVYNAVAEGIEDSFSEVGMLIFINLVRHRSIVIENERKIGRLSEEELDILNEALNIPLEEIPLRMVFSVRTTKAEETMEIRRQTMLMLVQTYNLYIQQTVPLLQQIAQVNQMLQADPSNADMKILSEHMMKAYTGATKLMSRIFEMSGELDTETYVHDWKKLDQIVDVRRQMMAQLAELQGATRGNTQRIAQAGQGAGAGVQGTGVATGAGTGTTGLQGTTGAGTGNT